MTTSKVYLLIYLYTYLFTLDDYQREIISLTNIGDISLS